MTALTTRPVLDPHTLAVEKARAQFAANTDEHTITVLLDSPGTGHRHLRFARPGTGIWSFDVITTPGRLIYTGDVGHFVFAGISGDPLAFFGLGGGGVNPYYWVEKVRAGVTSTGFNHVVFSHHLTEAIEAYRDELSVEEFADLARQVDDELSGCPDAESARHALDEFAWSNDDGDVRVSFDDDDIETDGLDHHYLLTCHALRWAASQWQARS